MMVMGCNLHSICSDNMQKMNSMLRDQQGRLNQYYYYSRIVQLVTNDLSNCLKVKQL